MTRLAALLAFGVTCSLIPACGDNVTGLESTATGIFPSEAFLGRRARVEITGVGTHWDDQVAVDFGDGIEVGTIDVGGPGTIFVDILVYDTTPPGDHDVTVVDGTESLTIKNAFKLKPPIALHLQGNIAQGAIGLFSIINRDFDAPFDTSSFQESIFNAPIFVNLAIHGPVGTTFAIDEVTPYTITGLVQIDIDAELSGGVEVVSGPINEATLSPLGTSITITPRAATALVTPTKLATLAMPFDSHPYSFVPAAPPHVARFAISSGVMNTSPRIFILPASGHFSDLLADGVSRATEVALATNNMYYAIVFDPRGAAGYDYTLAAASTSLDALPEAEPNDDIPTAQVHDLPLLFTSATLASQQDQDWLAVDIAPADVGKRVHIITTSMDPMTDTRVDVLTPSMVSLGGPSSDNNYHEDFLSDPTTVSGTYYVKLAASQSVFFEPAHNTYVAAIFLE